MFCFIHCALLWFHGLPGVCQSAKDLVKKAEENGRGHSSYAEIKIQTVRPKWSREMQLKAWSKGNHLSMILVTAPSKEKGIAFLKKGKEIWNWIPSLERNVKLPPSMMSQSWMGTDFTNDDLVKESSILEDYTHNIVGEEFLDERKCAKILMIPKENAAVVWGKIFLWIDYKDYLILQAEYFDEEDILINRMRGYDIRKFGDRFLPARMVMEPADKPGHQTILHYLSLTFDQPINDRFFTTQNLALLK